MLVSDFIKECESYQYSREYFEIMQECYKLDLMDTYLKSREYIVENLNIVDSFGDNYFMESKNNNAIESESQKNKENIVVRLIKFIIDKLKKFIKTIKTIWNNIWKGDKESLSSTHEKNIKIDVRHIVDIRSITNEVSNEVGGFITGNNDKLAIFVKSSELAKVKSSELAKVKSSELAKVKSSELAKVKSSELAKVEDIDAGIKEADRDISNSVKAAFSEIIVIKLDHPIDYIPLTEPGRFVNIEKLFKFIDKGLMAKDKNCIYNVLKEPGTIKEVKINLNKDNCDNIINFINKMIFELEKKLKSDIFTIDNSLVADFNKAVSLIVKSSGKTINLITTVIKYRDSIRTACMN